MAKLYGSVNGQTKQITKLYGSADKLTSVSFTYGSTVSDGLLSSISASTFLSKFLATYPNYTWKAYGEIQRIDFSRYSIRPAIWAIEITTSNGSWTRQVPAANIGDWGITTTSNYGKKYATITPSYTPSAKEVKKLYGSVNGNTKLVYQA